ncbi:MBL fold metallo-hydrolase [Halovivax sp.]|uniref:MBL fold metallo-hydrolase n=1 Tax=Halovivax sp. TaxID=1935978 RepID=UPI0025BDFF4A|nr:MBL fold metallo-hydrolase [Halovivax sp.]
MVVEHGELRFERLGHASVRIETGDGTVIYLDPWSEVLDGAPDDGDLVFVTHDDFDHYDPDGIGAIARDDATVAVYEAVDASELAFDVVELPHEGERTVDGVGVRSIPAHNDPSGDHVDDDGDPFHDEGEVVGLVLTVDGTDVYYPSDTDFLDHHGDVDADVFLPPIGGHYTMDRHEAADFARAVDADLVLPVHYDTFEAIETDAEAFREELAADGIAVELF